MHILEGYYNNWTTEPQIAARVERLIVDMALEGISALELARRRERMRAFLRDRKAVFDSHYPPFFFVDKHPELADRFRMSFEACFQTATT